MQDEIQDEIPTVNCYVRGGQYVFVCEECGDRHYHGLGGGEGHRSSHCTVEGAYPRGYNLKYSPEEDLRSRCVTGDHPEAIENRNELLAMAARYPDKLVG